MGETTGLKAFDALFCFAIFAGLANFGHHAIQGDFGVFATLAIEADERALTAELEALRAERARLENAAARLDASYLDLDLLDETARATLGLIRPDERIPR